MKRKSVGLMLLLVAICFMMASCGDTPSSDRSIVGTWGMESGGINEGHGLKTLEKEAGAYYKIMEFREDGTFMETCGNLTASGTYSQKGSSIKYSYNVMPSGGPIYFAIHSSGSWMYQFWEDGWFTLYDYTSSLEVSMSMRRLK